MTLVLDFDVRFCSRCGVTGLADGSEEDSSELYCDGAGPFGPILDGARAGGHWNGSKYNPEPATVVCARVDDARMLPA